MLAWKDSIRIISFLWIKIKNFNDCNMFKQ